MKNTGVCTKCDGKEILVIEGRVGAFGAGNVIPAGFKNISVTRYVCRNCGFIEEWIDSENDIKKLAAKYPSVKENP